MVCLGCSGSMVTVPAHTPGGAVESMATAQASTEVEPTPVAEGEARFEPLSYTLALSTERPIGTIDEVDVGHERMVHVYVELGARRVRVELNKFELENQLGGNGLIFAFEMVVKGRAR